jgi:hypothetical protein
MRDREIQTSKVQTLNYQLVGADLPGGRAQDAEIRHIAGEMAANGALNAARMT